MWPISSQRHGLWLLKTHEDGEGWGRRNGCFEPGCPEFKSWSWHLLALWPPGMVFLNLSEPIHIENGNNSHLRVYVSHVALWIIKTNKKKKKKKRFQETLSFVLSECYQFSELTKLEHHIVFIRRRYPRLPGLWFSNIAVFGNHWGMCWIAGLDSRNPGALEWGLCRKLSGHSRRHICGGNSKSWKILKSPWLKHFRYTLKSHIRHIVLALKTWNQRCFRIL